MNCLLTTYLSQNDLLLFKLNNYYKEKENLNKMLDIISGKTKISISIIDWFVTNYSKNNNTNLIKENGERFNVYVNYKLNLKSFDKKTLDPFCRWERIAISIEDNQQIETTIGQLHFFKWAFENKIIDFINENYDIINKDMKSRNSTSKKKQNTSNHLGKTRKKREELSCSSIKQMKKEDIKTTIEFKNK
jgi:hypothetical protein